MSHFSVMVVTQNAQTVEKLLDPYWELDLKPEDAKKDPRSGFVEEIAAGAEEAYCRGILKESADFLKKEKEEIEGRYTGRRLWEVYTGFAERQNWATFIEEYSGEHQNDDGAWGYWHNPNAKWDWYVVGGRCRDMLRLKDGSMCDSAKASDIDFRLHLDPEIAADNRRFWEIIVEGQEPVDKAEKDKYRSMYNAEYWKRRFGDVENYIKARASFGTYAVLTADGEWHEPGEMGWWAMTSATPEQEGEFAGAYHERFIKPLKDNDVVTIVDCHI